MKKLKHFNIGYVWNKKRKKKTIAFNKRNMSLVVDVDSFLCRTRSQRLCIGSFKKSACKHEILDSNTGYDSISQWPYCEHHCFSTAWIFCCCLTFSQKRLFLHERRHGLAGNLLTSLWRVHFPLVWYNWLLLHLAGEIHSHRLPGCLLL